MEEYRIDQLTLEEQANAYYGFGFLCWIAQNDDCILYVAQYGVIDTFLDFVKNNCKVELELDYEKLELMGFNVSREITKMS